MTNIIELSSDRSLATLTLNRPATGNAIDLETAYALRDAISTVKNSGDPLMVLSARGGVFCAGGDVASMSRADHPSEYLDELARVMHEAIEMMVHSSVFVVAAVDGAVAGGGLGLVLAADYVIATRKASFVTAYSNVGLTPDSGVTSHLVRSLGLHRALSLLVSNRSLTAQEAEELGFVSEVVDDSDVLGSAIERARSIEATAGPALGEIKRLVRAAAETPLTTQLSEEQKAISVAVATSHAQGRIHEFVARSERRQRG